MASLPFCPAADELALEYLAPDARGITIHLSARRVAVPCPDCGVLSRRIHSRYARTLADLPWHGTAVRLRVRTRRFFCGETTCPRHIFAERLSATAERYARRTRRLAATLRSIALALGGEAGARLSGRLGMRASAATLLRRVRAPGLEDCSRDASPRVLGVDDWAWRKGRNYGTILVDLERSRVVDLLADRSADSLAAWLQAHPGVEVISRDRSGLYAEGASRGAPGAVQVADRWHLIRNLTDAVQRTLEGRAALLREASMAAGPPIPAEEGYAPRPPTRAERAKRERREHRLARYNEVVALRSEGRYVREIAEHVGLDVRTVRHWLRAGHFPERKERAPTASKLDPYLPYLENRIDHGFWNAAELWRELRVQGYTGGLTILKDEVRRRRCGGAHRLQVRKQQRRSARKTAWLLVLRNEELTAEDRTYVARLQDLSPEVRAVRRLASEFRRILTEQDLGAFSPWVEAARRSLLRHFATSLSADEAAVRAAIALPWSNGPVEGQVNRLKLLKRQMYGRASFDLLRERVLHAA